MMDWYNLLMNALWILACALALTTLSYASWLASATGKKFRVCLGNIAIQNSLNAAGVLFCIGLAGTSEVLWQRILWILLALGFIVQIGAGIFRSRTKSNSKAVEN